MGDALEDVKTWLKARDNRLGPYIGAQWVHRKDAKPTEISLPDAAGKETKVTLSVTESLESDLKPVAGPLNTGWVDPKSRQRCLGKLAQLLVTNSKAVACLEALATGIAVRISEKRLSTDLINQLKYFSSLSVFRTGFAETQTQRQELTLYPGESLLSLGRRLLPTLAAGRACTLSINAIHWKSLLQVAYFVDLCHMSEFPPGIIELVLTERPVAALPEDSSNGAPSAVVFETSDLNSAVERLIEMFICDPTQSLAIFVQQSVYDKFVARFKMQWPALVTVGDNPLDGNINLAADVSINFEAIDIESFIERHVGSFQINVFKFRTNAEVVGLLNHANRLPSVSLWTESVTLALEFRSKIKNCSLFWINSMSVYHPSVAFYDGAHGNIGAGARVGLDCGGHVEINALGSDPNLVKTVHKSLAVQHKWNLVGEESRLKLMAEMVSASTQSPDDLLDGLHLTTDRLNFSKEVGRHLVLSQMEPIGVVAVDLDAKSTTSLNGLSRDLACLLLTGNAVVIGANGQELEGKVAQMIGDWVKRGLPENSVQIVPKLGVTGPSKMSLNGKLVGVCFSNIGQVFGPRKGNIDSLASVTKVKTTWIPFGETLAFAE